MCLPQAAQCRFLCFGAAQFRLILDRTLTCKCLSLKGKFLIEMHANNWTSMDSIGFELIRLHLNGCQCICKWSTIRCADVAPKPTCYHCTCFAREPGAREPGWPGSLVPESLVGRIRGSLLGLFRPGALQQSVATSDRVPYCSLSDLCEVVLLSRPGQETKLLLLAPLYTPMPPPIPHPPYTPIPRYLNLPCTVWRCLLILRKLVFFWIC